MPATADLLTTERPARDATPELLLKLRISETSRRIAQLPYRVSDVPELAHVAMHDLCDGLGLAAAAVWELDRTAAVWKLLAAAGHADRQPLRRLLQTVRLRTVDRSDAARAGAMIDDVDHLIRTATATDGRSDDYRGSSAILLRSTSKRLRVLA